ncbi:MAG: hypothetical protein IKU00_04345 [Bacteroidales bacterium]|nr:hypothetical protein [Bacteroidales bacterium]
MKRVLIILGTILIASIVLLSFTMNTKEPDNTENKTYATLWDQFKENMKKSLPESAGKNLDEIEKNAVKDKNQVQLLKVILYRQKVMEQTVEDEYEQEYLAYAKAQLDRLDEVPRAVLQNQIAEVYYNYLNNHEYVICENQRIDGDRSNVEMKYWDKQTFLDLIDYHYAEALKPEKALKAAHTEDYLCLFESKHDSYVEYEPSMFDFLFHRVANHYREAESADDVDSNWNTDLWWLNDKDFVKADLGDSDKPVIKCLKIFQQLIGYNMKNNPECSLYNNYKRYLFVNEILDETERYQDALRTMMKDNEGQKIYPELAAALASSMISQYDDHPNDSSLFDNYRKAYELCQKTIQDYSKGIYYCKRNIEHITAPYINLTLNDIQLPGENIPVVLEYRNVEHPEISVYSITEKELKAFNRLNRDEILEALDKKKPVNRQVMDLPAETDYRQHATLVALNPLNPGIYYLVAKTDSKAEIEHTALTFFQVSSLSFVTNERLHQLDIVVLDRKTGHPVKDATVEIVNEEYDYKKKEYETKVHATLKSDQDGLARTNGGIPTSFQVIVKKGNDRLLPKNYFNLRMSSGSSRPSDHTTLFTDRAIYRPGQTVYFKGIMVHHDNGKQTLVTNGTETIHFKDANWQEISSANFTTDEYGGFSGSFVIPTNLLNGTFHLNGSHGNTTISVEEYKRPTFEIGFDKIKEQYKLNEEVTVSGNVSALAGFGLDDVAYTYRVVRKTSFPWRCWWWWYPPIEDEQIAFGEGRTDETGKFHITFNLKPSLKTKPQQQPVFTYEIEVTATSAQGETHSDTHYIRAGYNKVALSTNIPDLVEQSAIGTYNIEVVNMNGQPASSRVKRLIYRFEEPEGINYFEANDLNISLDRQALSDQELHDKFPAFSFNGSNYKMQHKTLVYEDEVQINEKTSFYPGKTPLQPGKYYIELKSLDEPLAITSKEFKVYQKDARTTPCTTMAWYQTDKTSLQPGEVLRANIGSSAKNVRVWVQLMHGDETRMEQWITLDNEIKTITYTVKEEDRGGLCLKTAFIKENTYNVKSQSISVPYNNLDLNVTLATVRDKLSPGGEETWTVNVKDYQDKNVASALLAGMYDASLDAFTGHYWDFNMKPSSVWSKGFKADSHNFTAANSNTSYHYPARVFDYDLPSNHPFFEIYGRRYYRMVGGGARLAKGMVVEDDMAVAEVAMPMEKVNSVQMMEDNTVLQDVSYSATQEESGQSQPKQDAEPALRENFNETAFFFPNLRTKADGSCTFSFTLPDAITRWNLMMLAYTKDNQTGYKEYEFKASKPVMIMADMPRYMYDTDELWFVANVINTGDEAVTPKAKLEIFDAATMKPVNLIVGDPVINMQEIVPGRSKEVRWKVAAQYDLNLLAFRFTAYAGQFSDAEQHLMPVLSSEIFLTQTLPITVKAETEKTFDFDAIANPNSHERDYSLTLNFSTNPVWYAVQSLPYLANVRIDRPETAFYAFYANSLSAYIADHIPNLLAYIKRWQIETPDALLSQLEKDQDLKAIMLQETPWVLEAKSESEQRARIANLFDLNNLKQQQTSTLDYLADKQQYNGGWPWMPGMPESPYITAYILTGFGKLKQMGVWESMSQADQRKAERICEKAVRFVESDIADRYREMKRLKKDWGIGSFTLQELYGLSFFEEQNSDRGFAEAKKYYLDYLGNKDQWTQFNFNQRSYAALVLHRYGNENTAKLIIQSFKECAQKNDEIGMYWPKKYFSFISHIATHANIMAAFAEIEGDQEMIDQLRVWLLTQKRTNMWENSASTADAIYALLMRGSDWFEEGKDVTLSFSGKAISTEGGEAGTGFIQRRWNANEVTEDMRHLTVNNPTPHLVWGGLFRQYFVPIDEVKSDESGFKIKREIFVETVNDKGVLLVPIGKRTLKVGDKLTVKLTFESSQDMSFVFVKDLRAAGFEPENVISRYHYGDGMCYYQSTTDTDMEFFIDFLPKGVHQLEYTMFVTKQGNLSNGYALIQCQYAPEFTAYSDGMRVRVGN